MISLEAERLELSRGEQGFCDVVGTEELGDVEPCDHTRSFAGVEISVAFHDRDCMPVIIYMHACV